MFWTSAIVLVVSLIATWQVGVWTATATMRMWGWKSNPFVLVGGAWGSLILASFISGAVSHIELNARLAEREGKCQERINRYMPAIAEYYERRGQGYAN